MKDNGKIRALLSDRDCVGTRNTYGNERTIVERGSRHTSIVKKARPGSAPGLNGVPYKVHAFHKCPNVLKHLWRLSKEVWRKGKMPPCWQQAEGCFIPKEEKSGHITQFMIIFLLNVEGKIFFSVLARRMTSYMTENNYVDTSVQREECLDSQDASSIMVSIIPQLMHEVNKKDLTITACI